MENLILYQNQAPAHQAEDTHLAPQIQLGVKIVSHLPFSRLVTLCLRLISMVNEKTKGTTV